MGHNNVLNSVYSDIMEILTIFLMFVQAVGLAKIVNILVLLISRELDKMPPFTGGIVACVQKMFTNLCAFFGMAFTNNRCKFLQ